MTNTTMMMKLNAMLLLLVAMSFLIACGGGEQGEKVATDNAEPTSAAPSNEAAPENTPEGVARLVLEKAQALENLDYDGLKTYTTEGSNAEIDAMKVQVTQMMGQLTDDQKTQFRAEVKKMAEMQNLDALTCAQEGEDKATCTYCCNPMGNDDKVFLAKIDGQWLVDMTRKE